LTLFQLSRTEGVCRYGLDPTLGELIGKDIFINPAVIGVLKLPFTSNVCGRMAEMPGLRQLSTRVVVAQEDTKIIMKTSSRIFVIIFRI